jgi:hypothetical protein
VPTLKRFLLILLYCVVILAVIWGLTMVIALVPIPFKDVIILLAWLAGGLACLWLLGRFLISILPDTAP